MSRAPDTPFRLAVPDLLAERGRRRDDRVATPVPWALDMSEPVADTSLVAVVGIEGTSGGVYVKGTATVPYRSTCHRCLTEFDHEVSIRFGELVGEGADYELDEDVVDLEPVLRDAVLGALPDSPICRSGCRGLCSVCGADLNSEPCPGHDDEPDTPFAVLRDLLEP